MDDDTVVVLSSAAGASRGSSSIVELRFRDEWWNGTGTEDLNLTVQTGQRPGWRRCCSTARGSEMYAVKRVVDLTSLDPWGMLVVRARWHVCVQYSIGVGYPMYSTKTFIILSKVQACHDSTAGLLESNLSKRTVDTAITVCRTRMALHAYNVM